MEYDLRSIIQNGAESISSSLIYVYLKSLGPSHSFLYGNASDIALAFSCYAATRTLDTRGPNFFYALTVAAVGTGAEVAQGLGIFKGTFDPLDIPMYFVGAGLAYGIDRLTFNKKRYNLDELAAEHATEL